MFKKPQLSAIVLSKNEGPRIDICLRSLTWVDEIILVDNMSTDDTVSLAKKYHVHILKVATNDFSLMRTEALRHAKGDWVLYIDADEQVTEQLKNEIISIINNLDVSGSPRWYFIKRDNWYMGRHWPVQDKLQRLFWRLSLHGWRGKVHETAIVEGSMGTLVHPLIHNTHRTLEEMLEKTNNWSEIEALLRLKESHPQVVWWRFLRVMCTGFFLSYIKEGGWKAGTIGIIESIYQGFSLFITYAKLWELQQKDYKS